jgi:hypothetical protein
MIFDVYDIVKPGKRLHGATRRSILPPVFGIFGMKALYLPACAIARLDIREDISATVRSGDHSSWLALSSYSFRTFRKMVARHPALARCRQP